MDVGEGIEGEVLYVVDETGCDCDLELPWRVAGLKWIVGDCDRSDWIASLGLGWSESIVCWEEREIVCGREIIVGELYRQDVYGHINFVFFSRFQMS